MQTLCAVILIEALFHLSNICRFSPRSRGRGRGSRPIDDLTKSLPLDIVLMTLSLLELPDWKAFSCVNLVCNVLASRLFWSHYHISWDETRPAANIIVNINALAWNPARARFVRFLTIGCGWRWTKELEATFGRIFDNMENLTSLSIYVPYNPLRSTIGGELGPLARLLEDRRSMIQLERFECNQYIFPSSPIINFLKSQVHLKYIRTPRTTKPIWGPPFTFEPTAPFDNLETIVASDLQIVNFLVPHCPNLRHLELSNVSINFPLPWLSPTLEVIEFSPPSPSDEINWPDQLAKSCPNIRVMRLAGPLQSYDKFGGFKCLEGLSFESICKAYEPEVSHVARSLALLPLSVKTIHFCKEKWTRWEGDDLYVLFGIKIVSNNNTDSPGFRRRPGEVMWYEEIRGLKASNLCDFDYIRDTEGPPNVFPSISSSLCSQLSNSAFYLFLHPPRLRPRL